MHKIVFIGFFMSDTPYPPVRGLQRGLYLLHELNRCDGGAGSAELAKRCGLHRTTVRRLLETLRAEGYVRRSDSDDSFRLTLKVRELSEGFQDDQWISALAAPLLGELLQEVVWPTDICTLDVDAMVIRETTHRFSRLSFHRSMVGRRLPLLVTATGRAYLANCPEGERRELLEILGGREDEQGLLARDPEYIDQLLLRTRHNGYGDNFLDWDQEQRIAAIALPIRHGEQLFGCLNLVYIAKAMPIEEAARRYLAAMSRVVDAIEQGLHNTKSWKKI
jgi:IclR family transcriptional regulator, mhp operon transcriptional activator